MRSLIKAVVAKSGIHRFMKTIKSGRDLIIAYHNIVPDEQYSDSLGSQHTSLSAFKEQIDWFADNFDIVPLPSLLNNYKNKKTIKGKQSCLAITFDDAYRGAVSVAIPFLSQRKIHSTLFVSPGCIGSKGFWWDELDVDGWAERGLYLEKLGGKNSYILNHPSTSSVARRSIIRYCEPCDIDDLNNLVAYTGAFLSIGMHGWDHENFSALSREEIHGTMSRSRSWIRENFPSAYVPILAYPYGLTSPEVIQELKRSDYCDSALIIDGGWMTHRHNESLFVPRLNIPAPILWRDFPLFVYK